MKFQVDQGNSVQAFRGIRVITEIRGMHPQPAELVELGRQEYKFLSHGFLKWGTPVVTVFSVPGRPGVQTVHGRTHWSRYVKDGWQSGVFLDEPLNEVFSEAMAHDLRSTLRYETKWSATIEFDLDLNRYPVTVMDYSAGGISVSGVLPQELPPSFALYGPELDDKTAIATGQILWKLPGNGGQTMFGAKASGKDLSWFFALAPAVRVAKVNNINKPSPSSFDGGGSLDEPRR